MRSRLVANIGWNYASGLTSTIGLLLLYPLAAAVAGAEAYGVWVLAFATVQLFTMLDFGLGTGVVRVFSRIRSDNEAGEKRASFVHLALYTFLILGVLLSAIALLVLPLYYASIAIPDQLLEAVGPICVLVSISILVSIVGRAANAILWAENRPDIERKASMVGIALRAAGILICIPFGGGVIGVAVAETISVLIGPIVCVVAVLREHGTPRLRRQTVTDHLIPLLRWSGVLFVGTLASLIAMQAPLYIVGATMGLVEATAFGAIARLYQSARLPVSWLANPFTAAVAGADDDSVDLARDLRRMYALCGAAAWLIAAPLVSLAPDILPLWMGERYTFASPGLATLCLGVIASGTILPAVLALNLRRSPWISSTWYVVWCLLSLPLVWWSASVDNLLYVGLAVSVPQLLIAIPLYVFSAKIIPAIERRRLNREWLTANSLGVALAGVMVALHSFTGATWVIGAYGLVLLALVVLLARRRRIARS